MVENINELLEVARISERNKIKGVSRKGYNGKIKYCINFMEKNYPDFVELDEGRIKQFRLPLSFESIKALFSKLTIDTDLPRSSKKRKKEEAERIEELGRIRAAIIARGGDEDDIPERLLRPLIRQDDSVNKENSVTIAKSCLGGYKSALLTYYSDRGMEFTCPDMPPGTISLDKYLDERIKSYGNLIADKKQRAIMSVTEGKNAMTQEGFVRIIDKLIQYKPKSRFGGRSGTKVIK